MRDSELWIVIDGTHYDVIRTREIGYGDLHQVDVLPRGVGVGGRDEYIVSRSRKNAGKAARTRWKDMAENDPSEFKSMVGEASLVAWALGQPAGPGGAKVRSLKEWLDLYLDHPEEEWATYDGKQRDIKEVSPALRKHLGFTPKVAYRSN